MLLTSTKNPPLFETYFEGGLVESLLYILVITILCYGILKAANGYMKRKKIDSRKSISHILRAILMIVWFLSVLSRIKLFQGTARTIFASSGIIAIVAGMAAQDTLGNLLSGVMIIAFKPFVVGDLIKMNGDQLIGFVEDITLRHTIVRTYENNRIIVPNMIVNKATIENANLVESIKGNYFMIPVSYQTNLEKASSIIKDEVQKHPHFIDARSETEIAQGLEAVQVHCIEYGPNNITLRCVIHSKDSFEGFQMLSDLRFTIKNRFDAEGIEMPYNHAFDPKD